MAPRITRTKRFSELYTLSPAKAARKLNMTLKAFTRMYHNAGIKIWPNMTLNALAYLRGIGRKVPDGPVREELLERFDAMMLNVTMHPNEPCDIMRIHQDVLDARV